VACEPRASHTDADRHVISNIHERGLGTYEAAELIVRLASRLMHPFTNGL